MAKIIKPAYWDRDHQTCDSNPNNGARQNLMAFSEGETITAIKQITVRASVLSIADVVADTIRGTLKSTHPQNIFVEGLFNESPTLASIVISGAEHDPEYEEDDAATELQSRNNLIIPEKIGRFTINVTGTRAAIAAVFTAVDAKFSGQVFAKVDWWYRSDRGGLQTRTIYLPPLDTELLPEFYPDIANGPRALIKDYLSSSASILLLAGQPGTGKTTLLRHMICENHLNAQVVYDEVLMENDGLFQGFLFGDSEIMIIEDADTILASREAEKNKLMARFLNVSDGLIKLPNKKLVFTTNLSDFARIDQALMRPGRCYGVLHTRPLDLAEAQAAAKAAKLPIPLEKRQYTLAELFNTRTQQTPVRRIGFAE